MGRGSEFKVDQQYGLGLRGALGQLRLRVSWSTGDPERIRTRIAAVTLPALLAYVNEGLAFWWADLRQHNSQRKRLRELPP